MRAGDTARPGMIPPDTNGKPFWFLKLLGKTAGLKPLHGVTGLKSPGARQSRITLLVSDILDKIEGWRLRLQSLISLFSNSY